MTERTYSGAEVLKLMSVLLGSPERLGRETTVAVLNSDKQLES